MRFKNRTIQSFRILKILSTDFPSTVDSEFGRDAKIREDSRKDEGGES